MITTVFANSEGCKENTVHEQTAQSSHYAEHHQTLEIMIFASRKIQQKDEPESKSCDHDEKLFFKKVI